MMASEDQLETGPLSLIFCSLLLPDIIHTSNSSTEFCNGKYTTSALTNHVLIPFAYWFTEISNCLLWPSLTFLKSHFALLHTIFSSFPNWDLCCWWFDIHTQGIAFELSRSLLLLPGKPDCFNQWMVGVLVTFCQWNWVLPHPRIQNTYNSRPRHENVFHFFIIFSSAFVREHDSPAPFRSHDGPRCSVITCIPKTSDMRHLPNQTLVVTPAIIKPQVIISSWSQLSWGAIKAECASAQGYIMDRAGLLEASCGSAEKQAWDKTISTYLNWPRSQSSMTLATAWQKVGTPVRY